MSSTLVSPPVVKAKALNCPNCGAPVELRGFAHTLSVVCPNCHSVLDASSPLVSVVQKAEEAQSIEPLIPLGSRGKFEGTEYEVIGFQVRSTSGEEDDSWSEYLLFNPYKGFRYLSEYENHWNFIRVQSALPIPQAGGVSLFGRAYRRLEHATAITSYVIGEFPWQVRVGETVEVEDYVSPPYMLSAEITADETVWSRGEYYPSERIWSAFGIQNPNPAPPPTTFGNQPSPYKGRVGSAWRIWVWLMVALTAVVLYFSVTSTDKEVFQQKYSFAPRTAGEPSFVTSVFELTGRPNNIRIDIDTDLSNNWAYFNFALIDQDTGRGYDFGREVSYYFGRDSDGNWTEGKPRNSVTIPDVPPGKYYLRVEPEMDATASPMQYELVVRRGVITWTWIWLAALLLAVPPIYLTVRSIAFESARFRQG